VLIEEIEKVTSPENINCLLQVMDTRGAIQRTNARDGDVYAECKVVVWATCNDSEYLRTFADGAIWSRGSVCARSASARTKT
jgi:MoxR-like ATPase